MSTISKKGMVAALTGAIALTLVSQAGSAYADSAPQGTDIVGVGSDTVQFIGNFGADGSPLGDPGYNTAGNVNRLYSFDATPDANARAGYLNGSTSASLKNLTPTIVLRAGKSPVQRPNGSGSGISALLADSTASTRQLDYVRASRLPTAAEQSSAGTKGYGYLHVVQVATDPLQVAVANTTNAPAGISAQELVSIYSGAITHWNDLPGNSSGSTDTIIPLIPQTGSGTRSSFLADLQAANGGTAVTLAASVLPVEENDPAAITTAATPADAIVPFSGGRLNLLNTGYLHNPTGAYPTTGALTVGIKVVTGTPGDTNPVYLDTRGLYFIYRDSDRTSTTPFQPGSTKNYVNSLFSGSTPFFKGSSGAADVAAAGVTPSYSDLGNVSAG